VTQIRIGRYRHYLGTWDAGDRVRIAAAVDGAWRAPSDDELAQLRTTETLGDAAEIAESADAVMAAMTVPAKVRRELWALEWDDESEAMTPRDADAFAAYGRGVVAFFRAAGVPLGGADAACDTRLVAATPGRNPAEVREGRLALVNVGEADCTVAMTGEAGAVSLRVPPDEACLLSRGARLDCIIVPTEAEFGLLLELGR
jgi:hypothetical protein